MRYFQTAAEEICLPNDRRLKEVEDPDEFHEVIFREPFMIPVAGRLGSMSGRLTLLVLIGLLIVSLITRSESLKRSTGQAQERLGN